ncbi:MAG TPA: hypothetical protein VGY91_08545 [Chthoniobacterales bacterium]|nr:hypothetical protein [Chthoniobacterales bacterium]
MTDSELSRSGVDPPLTVEQNQLSTSEALGAFYRVYLEFILRRVIHDLGNSISGINSLSDYHLRSGVNDPGLEESLGLIRESAEHSRDVLIMVSDLLQPPETAEEFVKPSELIREASKMASMLLPRSVRLEFAEAEDDGPTGVSVVRGEFLRRFLALAAMDVSHLRIASGQISLGWEREGARIRIFYRSKFNPPSDLRDRASIVMARVSREVEVSSSRKGEEFTLSLYFPAVQLSDPGSIC